MSSFTSGPRDSAGEPASEDTAAAESACGPGWYESSWDLRCGLVVVERQVDGPAALNQGECPHEWLLRHARGETGEPEP
jgi:hypothetical protein